MCRYGEARKAYSTDLTDEQWELIEDLLPAPKTQYGGRPRAVSLREVMNAILYLNRTGCQWEMLPHDLPPKSTVYEYFAPWRDNGVWIKIIDALRSQIREQEGREATPSAVCIDSQSAKTTEMGGEARGYDGGKKIKGRKRHLLVDTMGLLIAVVITAANVDDGAAAPLVLEKVTTEAYPRLEIILGDNKYHNKALEAWLKKERPGWKVEVSSPPKGSTGFVTVPKRWVVERSNAWHGKYRRNSKDYERRPESSTAMIGISHMHVMVRRLAPVSGPRFNYNMAA